jgi:tetratricopeptide (TPR) repeat protein
MNWFLTETLKAFTSPVALAGSLLDGARGWRYSRRWIKFCLFLPAFALILFVYLAYGFSLFERTDTRVQRYSVRSERIVRTAALESAAYEKFPFLGVSVYSTNEQSKPFSEYSLRFARLLSDRILGTQPRDTRARYRLALIKIVDGPYEEGVEDMKRVASGEFETYRPANAWLASYWIQMKFDKTGDVDEKELIQHLKLATEWDGVRPQLQAYYAQILAVNGVTNDAIAAARDAAKKNRELNLELLRLYNMMGNSEGVRAAGHEVEEVFGAKLNTSSERIMDRLAVAEARFLMGKPDAAISVLNEALAKENVAGRVELSRMLSLIRINMFEKSIQKLDDGSYIADTSLLDLAAEADPDNPKISEQVAKLLPLKIRPSRNILAVLRKQIETGVTSGESHRLLARAYSLVGNKVEAMKNWEYAIQKDPKDVVAINNLALSLAREAKPDFPRALELIAQADKLAPNNAEILDTHGQILVLASRHNEAIPKLEGSIRIDGSRLATRKLLLECYRKANMTDLANAQAKVIESMAQPTNGSDR